MTAVFALVEADTLFVAGDTQRGTAIRLTVQKVHSWGDEVVFGQAGNSHQQSNLISELKLKRCLPAHVGENALWALYNLIHQMHRAGVTPPARPNGTILAAALDVGAGVPGLVTYDFDTGLRTPLSANVAATGADDAALTAIAIHHLQRLRSASGLPLDEWARCCVADAVAAFPNEIGWPCDMIVSRVVSQGGRKIVERRIDRNSTTGVADFVV